MADFTGIKPPRATPRRIRYDLLVQRLALLGLVIGVWWIYSLGEPHFKFPGPPRVYEAFKVILGNGDLWRNLAITLERVCDRLRAGNDRQRAVRHHVRRGAHVSANSSSRCCRC